MSLPTPNLDDLRFQRDLVDEARRRIVRYCPEWTEYNLSDPGITLIELFAWMTEMIVYRLNRVPEKNYIKFLELLGLERRPASSARTELTFWLSVSLPITPDNREPVVIPKGIQVMTRQGGEEEIIFTTDRTLTIIPPTLTQLRRGDEFQKNYLPRLGIEAFYAFGRRQPQEGDTFYLGFDPDEDIGGHILRLSFECESTKAVGVRREDPPWVWECSVGDGQWRELPPSDLPGEKDTTGGLNNPSGSLVLYLPLDARPDRVRGRLAYWIRCRLEQRRPEQGMYAESPRVIGLRAETLGGTVTATHSLAVENEILGRSNGEPGQSFQLGHAPILALEEGEVVEVEEKRGDELVFVPWQLVPDFANSNRYDRHFAVDTSTGEVSFGPAIRQPDGTVRQYGRVPETGRAIRFTRYRYGGGARGNVPANSLQVMMTSLAYVSRVTNLRRATGGRDPESMEEVKARARRELRSQQRAVTADDYEELARQATRAVARVKCNAPGSGNRHLPPGVVELLVVPAAHDSLRAGDLSGLYLGESLIRELRDYLDHYRLLTTVLQIREPTYIGVRVDARVVADDYVPPETVQARVVEALRNFISPLPLQASEGGEEKWEGWPFGRNLYVAEVFSLIQDVPGVRHVLDVRLSTRPVVPREERPPEGGMEEPESPEDEDAAGLTPVTRNLIPVPADALLCSLAHRVATVETDEWDA